MTAPDELPARDEDGFLLDRHAWNEDCAARLARIDGVALGPAQLEVLHVLRAYYERHEHAPAMRALVSLVKRELGPDKGRSVYLLGLFPGSPAKLAARWAGLPKPEHCL
jgi:tRNA 2-thiouridine synthesizing protein E